MVHVNSRSLLLLYLAFASAASRDQTPLRPPSDHVTVSLSPEAVVLGSVSASAVENFDGIPYAEPPVASQRLRPPRKASKPSGVFDATRPPVFCPQMPLLPDGVYAPRDFKDAPFLSTVDVETGEDCLTVSVQRPTGTKEGDELPVLVGIFGNLFASGNTGKYNADTLTELAKSRNLPFIFVTVNYRAAGFGFLGGKEILADGAANLGLLDQRLALEWVADNIASFGGDPGKVTLWGESSGAMSVMNQMVLYGGDATYNGKPLFHGAILNSGSAIPTDAVDSAKAQRIYDAVVEKAGCAGQKDTLQCLRALPYDAFLEASNSVPRVMSRNSTALSYAPRPDGTILMEPVLFSVIREKYHSVPIIIGTQEDEGTVFSWAQTDIATTSDLNDYLTDIYNFERGGDEVINLLLKHYPSVPSAGSPFRTGLKNMYYSQYKRLAAILGDILITAPRRAITKYIAKRTPVWSYLDAVQHSTPWLGTSHATAITPGTGGSLDLYYLPFLYYQNPNAQIPSGPGVPWPRVNSQKPRILNFQDSTIFPIVHIQDNFRFDALDFVLNATLAGHFNF